ncbi:MAG: zinc-dependent alcohol dehydrogenase family protein [Planctomycetaceae bacterium]
MHAAQFDRFGEPADVLKIADLPEPALTPGTVRVRMLASPINPSDLMTIRGIYGRKPPLPAVPGYEGVGIVEAAQAGLYGKFLLGKRVAVLNGAGGNWQQQVILPAKQAVPLDGKLTNEQAATFFVNPAAAFIMTRKILAVPAGNWLLQTAAGSALGKMVIRLGKKFGFRTLNVVRRPEQISELKSLGADAVITFDGDRDPSGALNEQVRSLAGPDGVRFAIDPVGGKTASAVVPCLGVDGRLLLYGTLSSEPMSYSPRELMTVASRVEGFWLSRYMLKQGLLAKLGLMRSIGGLIHEGVLTTEIGETFPLEQIAAAVRAAETPAKSGKVLLKFSEK